MLARPGGREELVLGLVLGLVEVNLVMVLVDRIQVGNWVESAADSRALLVTGFFA